MEQTKILLIDFNPVDNSLANTLQGILESSVNSKTQFRQESINVYGEALCNSDFSKVISDFHPDLIFLVSFLSMPEQANLLCQAIQKESSELPILAVIEKGKSDEIFELFKLGIADFIIPPLEAIDILPRIWRALEWTHRSKSPIQTLKEKFGLKQFIGESPAFLTEVNKIPLVAKCDVSILISGETGTGKELCARAIHYLSLRAHQPFIPVNCGAIPVDLIENELFGHERGAFTGASTSQSGLIQEAHGGTLFLDEIDCLLPLAQVKLLRFIQEKEYRSLGSTRVHRVDVRVIAATNTDLDKTVREGKFRSDLYYRLNVIPIVLPPLRERREDIPMLASHFLAEYSDEFSKQVTHFSSNAVKKLVCYDWPGNVRELENVVQRAVVLSRQPVIQAADIVLPHPETTGRQESFREAKARIVRQFERRYIQKLLLAHRGNITKAAQSAQKNRRAFWQLIRKHGIDVQNFKSGIS